MNFTELVTSKGLFCDGDWIEKKDQDPNGTVRLIQLADIGVCEFKDKSERFITENKAEELHCTYLQKGDILVARLPDPLGRACIFPLDGKYITAVDVTVVRIARDDVNSKYVMYMINSPGFRNEIKKYESGTTRKRVSRRNLDKIEFDIPLLTEQKRIVARIEELFSELDNGVETLRKIKRQLAVYRQAVLKEAFDKAGQKQVPLRGIIEKPRYGTSKKCSYDIDEHSLSVYRIPNINYFQGTISHDDLKYASFTEDEFDSLKLRSGDILIIRSNGSVSLVGRSAIVAEEDTNGLFAGYLMRLRIKAKAEILPKYLNLYLSTHYARHQIEKMAKSTSGVNNINSDEICRICLPVCDMDLQREIIREIEARLSVCDSIEKTVDTTLQQAEAMRQSILKQAFDMGWQN